MTLLVRAKWQRMLLNCDPDERRQQPGILCAYWVVLGPGAAQVLKILQAPHRG